MLHEWFHNAPHGIEHGYTINARPTGAAPLWIGLEFSGDLSVRIETSGRSAVLIDARGDVRMHYRNLTVVDASGRELDARLETHHGNVGFRIEDAHAIYPVTIDPLITGPSWTVSGQSASQFGSSVASAGDVNGDGYSDVIVGAMSHDSGEYNEGAAFVYLGSSNGLAFDAAWSADGNQSNAWFGGPVACAGDVNGDGYSDVIVASYAYDIAQSDEGRAFLYLGSPDGLGQSAAWTANGDEANAKFAYSVATAGDVNGDGFSDVIIGAPDRDHGESDEGCVFVYLGSATGLGAHPAWTAESNQAGAEFGARAATAGDVNGDRYGDVIVGAPTFDGGEFNEGRAFLYLGSANGLNVLPVWTAEGNQEWASFGVSVATAGDVNGDGCGDVIVGASWHHPYPEPGGLGRALVYLGSKRGLEQTPSWAAWATGSSSPQTQFGHCVATAGDVNGDGYSDVVIGAYGFSTSGLNAKGRVYVYLGSPSGLSTQVAWTVTGQFNSSYFGAHVATAGDVNGDGYSDVIVGAHGTSDGSAYVYNGGPSGLSSNAQWNWMSHEGRSSFGHSVSCAGDVNGDGYSDVVVGAHIYDSGEINTGRALAFMGSSDGLSTQPAWITECDQSNAEFGRAVAFAGDVNGDGYGDVLVGAPRYSNGQADEGRAFVYLGSMSGLASDAAWTVESDKADALFGGSVSAAGDVNGDGYGDVIVGARGHGSVDVGVVSSGARMGSGYTNAHASASEFELTFDAGRAFAFYGSPSGPAKQVSWTANGEGGHAHFASSVAGAGDVNGDGYSDVIVGAPGYASLHRDAGAAYVYLGSRAGLAAAHAWSVSGERPDALLGTCVATAGDVNGDGYSDVIVGSPGFAGEYRWPFGDTESEGRADIFLGSSTGLDTSSAWSVEGDAHRASLGFSVASAGDVNGDGFGDVIVGAPAYVVGFGSWGYGRALVYLGSASGVAEVAAWSTEADQSSSILGHSVASAGDVNGDGYSDLIVGAPFYESWGGAQAGSAQVFLGSAGNSWTRRLQQRRSDDSAPLSVLAHTNGRESFRIAVEFDHDLAGFDWVSGVAPIAKLEWEIKPFGVPFDEHGIESGASQVISGMPLVFNEFVDPTQSLRTPPRSTATHCGSLAGLIHWRARIRTNNPLLPVTPWVSLPENSRSEAKLRIVFDLATRGAMR